MGTIERRRRYLLQRNRIIYSYILSRRLEEPNEWCRFIFMARPEQGHHAALLPELRNEYPALFLNYTRMSDIQFDTLLSLVGDKLTKQTTNMRTPISASERLFICLRFLATGCNYTDLSYAYRVGKSTICGIIRETCAVIYEVLAPTYLTIPSSKEEWEAIAAGFAYRWDFPNCVDAIDGKHIAVKAPPSSGSMFYNYKGFHSIVLMAACDAQYSFTFVDEGNYGKISDGGVFAGCQLGKDVNDGAKFLPAPAILPNSNKILPHVFVADEAFPSKENLVRPFPGTFLNRERRIYNYRLSRARRCIENAFGVLASRWRVLLTTMQVDPDKATDVTLACCCLHNFLLKEENGQLSKTYCPRGYSDGEQANGRLREGLWRQEVLRLNSVVWHCWILGAQVAYAVRDGFLEYFSNVGAAQWQNNLFP